ncbi:MAG: acyl-CoA thioesterase [Spirochaetes bacterium]|jgi:acyl-CoA hydrolase|nr:acyl-CoA thioesterase [Spirochaetota bacterium]
MERRVNESAIEMVQQMSHQDANLGGNVHGGVIMKAIDTTAGIVAARHAGSNVVTASIDRLDFHSPVYIGDILRLKASLNYAGRTSMEVGVRVEAENFISGVVRHTASAYLTFVSLDAQGRPVRIPGLVLETDEQRRRNAGAATRRSLRIKRE